MLLADGHVVYYGGAQSVLPWAAALGFECPYGVNVADFLLDLAQGEVAGGHGKGGGGRSGGKGGVDLVAEEEEGGVELSGPDAVNALWASYEEFHK